MNTEECEGWMAEFSESGEFQRAFVYETVMEGILSKAEEAMKDRDITRQELARRIGCPLSQVTEVFERNENESMRALCGIVWSLGLTIDVNLVTMPNNSYAQQP